MGLISDFTNSKSVSACFQDAVKLNFSSCPVGLIVPHAGYIYSGSVAASAYQLLSDSSFKTVYILGIHHGFGQEHSIEVQIPLLRYILKYPFKLEKIYVDNFIDLKIDSHTLVIASSDLSHYQPLNIAQQEDKNTINAILSLDEKSIIKQADACGLWPILNLNRLANLYHWLPKLIDYQTSASVTGDTNQVVGYASIAYFSSKTP